MPANMTGAHVANGGLIHPGWTSTARITKAVTFGDCCSALQAGRCGLANAGPPHQSAALACGFHYPEYRSRGNVGGEGARHQV